MSWAAAINPVLMEREQLERNPLDRSKLPITNPVPLVLDCPAPPYKVQRGFGAGGHRIDEVMDAAKWLAVLFA
jgi:hypothetical protein